MNSIDILEYSLQNNIIDESFLVSSDFSISKLFSNNSICFELKSNNENYFVKVTRDNDSLSHLINENKFYNDLAIYYPRIRNFIPKIFHNNTNIGILVLEFIKDSSNVTFFEHQESIYQDLGKKLALIHNVKLADYKEPIKFKPFIFEAFLPNINDYYNYSEDLLKTIRIIQQSPELCQLVETCKSVWSNNTVFVHGDLKEQNLIIKSKSVFFIDWETHGIGCPFWDIGSVFAMHIESIISKIDLSSLKEANNNFLTFLYESKSSIQLFFNSYLIHSRLKYSKILFF